MELIDLQDLCEHGQRQLMAMDYLSAEATLEQAEQLAWDRADWDTLSRLYMPLQEARRQRRQRCGEGAIRFDLLAQHPDDHLDPARIVEQFPHGQLLVAGWKSINTAVQVRALARQRRLYVETFLAAVYPLGEQRVVVIVPAAEVELPQLDPPVIDKLLPRLPAHSIVMSASALPSGATHGTPQTFASSMQMWERLHAPYLALADATTDPVARMSGYRRTIEIDYACELAHQKLSHTAREMTRAAK